VPSSPANCELPLQILALDDQVLVVCAGPCGEAFSFIERADTDSLIEESLSLHRLIDRLPTVSDKIPHSRRSRLAKRMQDLGELIFLQVFKGRILDLLNVTVGQAIRQNINVTVRLMIVTDWLNIIPWELLCSRGTYLCHTYDFVRHPFAIQPVRTPLTPGPNINVLFVGGNPRNDIYVEDQLSAARKAVDQMKSASVCILSPDATYTSIADAIYTGTDILHFVAHGDYSMVGGSPRGYFLIDGEGDRKEDRLPIEMLQSFCRASPMQLAILSACRSDQALLYSARRPQNIRDQRYGSMAHALIQVGVPCVIGMSHPISKVGASVLARRLYHVLINKRGSIDKAVRQARLELFAHMDDLLPTDWMTPVLYSRTKTHSPLSSAPE
jgi:CHAT domain-containing protein